MVADTKGGKGSLSTGKIEPAVGAQVRCLAPAKLPAPLTRISVRPRAASARHLAAGNVRIAFGIFFACIVADGR